jgi:hypothetical protein
MKIQDRDYTINSDGTLSIKKNNGNISTITGKLLGYDIKIEKIEKVGANYRVTANGGITKDILPTDADKLISFVDTGSPKTIKRQNAGFLEPSLSLFLVRETTPSGQTTEFEIQPTGLSMPKKIGLAVISLGILYFVYRKVVK